MEWWKEGRIVGETEGESKTDMKEVGRRLGKTENW